MRERWMTRDEVGRELRTRLRASNGWHAPATEVPADGPGGSIYFTSCCSHRIWVGEWDVFVGEQQVGTNRISKILDGCAVTEEWRSAGGGRSLVYFLPWRDEWKRVWVTSAATRTGGVKEKTLVEVLDGGAALFQGPIPDSAGDSWYDRTILSPLPDGNVR